mgnify:FL=1
MTRLVVISDSHTKHDDLILPNGEILIHCGDFTFRGEDNETINFLVWAQLQSYKYRHVIAGFGNHEVEIENCWENFKELQRCYAPDVKFLKMNSFTDKVSGLKFFGYPYVPYINGRWSFEKHRGKEILEQINKIPKCDILISHGPPFGILDEMKTSNWVIDSEARLGWKKEEVKVNIGCQDLLEAIPRIGCKAVLFGHIHESYGRYTDLNGVQYINAAVLDEQYELTHQPMVIDV